MTKIASHSGTKHTGKTQSTSKSGKTGKGDAKPQVSDHVGASCNDPSMKVHVTSPQFGRGNVVIKGNASDNGICPSMLQVTLPPYCVGGPIIQGQPPRMAPAQNLSVSLTGGETPKEAAEKLATRIGKETGFQAEVRKVSGGYEVVVSDKMRAL